jgi:aminoglycoside 6'-N-acetyltransferase I
VNLTVRSIQQIDHAVWVRMRAALWPNDPPSVHATEIASLLDDKWSWAFLAETDGGMPAGFAEVTLRTCANGCDSQPVPFLEGIWPKPSFRRQGVGRGLVRHIEAFLLARGFAELGSDADIENRDSQTAHRRWGFGEIERVVCYRKALSR